MLLIQPGIGNTDLLKSQVESDLFNVLCNGQWLVVNKFSDAGASFFATGTISHFLHKYSINMIITSSVSWLEMARRALPKAPAYGAAKHHRDESTLMLVEH